MTAIMRLCEMAATLGVLVGCSQSSSPATLPPLDTVDAAPLDTAGSADPVAAPVHCGLDAGVALDSDDPTVVVTDWSQVQRYNCARDDAGQIVACGSDEQCPTGRVCDNSVGCGCCVAPPPSVDESQPLRRALFTGCANGSCAAPSYCTAAADGRGCAMTFPGTVAVWAMRHEAPVGACPLDDFRRQLCVKVEEWHACLWLLDLPGGSYGADAPFPTDYTDTYECGGRTCNGAESFRVRPRAGTTFTATLVVDNCSPR